MLIEGAVIFGVGMCVGAVVMSFIDEITDRRLQRTEEQYGKERRIQKEDN